MLWIRAEPEPAFPFEQSRHQVQMEAAERHAAAVQQLLGVVEGLEEELRTAEGQCHEAEVEVRQRCQTCQTCVRYVRYMSDACILAHSSYSSGLHVCAEFRCIEATCSASISYRTFNTKPCFKPLQLIFSIQLQSMSFNTCGQLTHCLQPPPPHTHVCAENALSAVQNCVQQQSSVGLCNILPVMPCIM